MSFQEFEFDLPSALLGELITRLDGMSATPLDKTATAAISDAQGVYQLFHDGALVYIGKTDAEAGLKTRLSRHARKILHRPTLKGDVTFKALRIMVFTAMDLETQLIKHYRGVQKATALWNGTGFGSNDPGRERETTNKPAKGFDPAYPISIDLLGIYAPPGASSVADALARLKAAVPYTIRYETMRDASGRALAHQPHPDLTAASIDIAPGPHTVRDLLKAVQAVLGTEWQITVFVSHVILYKEKRTYTYGQVL